MRTRLVILCIMLVNAAGIGVAASNQRGAHAASESPRMRFPWMVSVVHKINLVPAFNYGGMQASTVDGSSAFAFNLTTGIVMDREGHIMTRLLNVNPNNPSPDVSVKTNDGRTMSAEILGLDGSSGLTVLKVPDLNIDPPTFADDSTFTDGDIIQVLSPDFLSSMNRYFNSTSNNATGNNREVDVTYFPTMKLLSTTARLTRVNNAQGKPVRTRAGKLATAQFVLSTAPQARKIADDSVLLNRRGQVIGLTLVEQSDNSGTVSTVAKAANLAYPIADAKMVAERIIRTRSASRAWLGVSGVSITDLSQDERNAFVFASQLPAQGIIVSRVEPQSPAAVGGLLPNDVLVSFNNQQITSSQQFSQILSATPIGETSEIVTLRGGKAVKVEVKLTQRPFVVVSQTATLTPGRNNNDLAVQDLRYRITILENEMQNQEQRLVTLKDETERRALEDKLRSIKDVLDVQKSALAQLEASLAVGNQNVSTTATATFSTVSLQLQLGLVVKEVSDQLREYFGAPDHQGVLIETVKAGGLGDQAGLKAGDVLVELNGMAVTNLVSYQFLLNAAAHSRKVKAIVIRDKTRKEITFDLPDIHSQLIVRTHQTLNL